MSSVCSGRRGSGTEARRSIPDTYFGIHAGPLVCVCICEYSVVCIEVLSCLCEKDCPSFSLYRCHFRWTLCWSRRVDFFMDEIRLSGWFWMLRRARSNGKMRAG